MIQVIGAKARGNRKYLNLTSKNNDEWSFGKICEQSLTSADEWVCVSAFLKVWLDTESTSSNHING